MKGEAARAAARHPDRPQGHLRHQGHAARRRIRASSNGNVPAQDCDLHAAASPRPARCCSASSRRTSSRSAARPSTCPGRRRAIRGIPRISPAARRAAPAPRWRPASSSAAWAPTPAARSACPRRSAASPASSRPTASSAAPASSRSLLARPCRADGLDGRGLRPAAAGDGRPRSRRPGERRPAGARFPRRARRTAPRACASAWCAISTSATTRSTRRRGTAIDDGDRVLSPRGRRDPRGDAVAARRLARLRPRHHAGRGLCRPRAVDAHAAWTKYGELLRDRLALGALVERRRLCPGACAGGASCARELAERWRSSTSCSPRPCRPRRRASTAVPKWGIVEQPNFTSPFNVTRLSRDVGLHRLRRGRAAARDAARRQAVRRADAASRRPRLRARHALARPPPAARRRLGAARPRRGIHVHDDFVLEYITADCRT